MDILITVLTRVAVLDTQRHSSAWERRTFLETKDLASRALGLGNRPSNALKEIFFKTLSQDLGRLTAGCETKYLRDKELYTRAVTTALRK